MTHINYKIADITVRISYDIHQMTANAEESMAILEGTRDDIFNALGYFGDVDDVSELEYETGIFILHGTLLYDNRSTGNEKEHERIEFLESMAMSYAMMQEMDVIKQAGVSVKVELAEHNKAQFNLYLLEAEKELNEEPVLPFNDKVVETMGDGCLSVFIYKDEFLAENSEDKVQKTLQLICNSISQHAFETLEPLCDVERLTHETNDAWVFTLRLSVLQPATKGCIIALLMQMKTSIGTLQKMLNDITNCAKVGSHVKAEHRKLKRNIHFLGNTLH